MVTAVPRVKSSLITAVGLTSSRSASWATVMSCGSLIFRGVAVMPVTVPCDVVALRSLWSDGARLEERRRVRAPPPDLEPVLMVAPPLGGDLCIALAAVREFPLPRRERTRACPVPRCAASERFGGEGESPGTSTLSIPVFYCDILTLHNTWSHCSKKTLHPDPLPNERATLSLLGETSSRPQTRYAQVTLREFSPAAAGLGRK